MMLLDVCSLTRKLVMIPCMRSIRPSSGWLGDSPTFSFHGKAKRADISNGLPACRPTSNDDPGPGAYPMPMSLGSQIESRKQSSGNTRVGREVRDVRYKVYLSKEHEPDLFGKHSPAPNTYNPSVKPVSY